MANETITKNDIAREVAEKNYISKTLSYQIVCDVFKSLVEKVMAGNRIEIRNFGIFTKKIMKEREGRNPQNGAPITIQAKSTIKFKPSKSISFQNDKPVKEVNLDKEAQPVTENLAEARVDVS